MSRRSRGRTPKLPPFVAMPWDLLNSVAYLQLPNSACKVLPFFIGKPKTHLGNGQAYEIPFIFPYQEAKRLGLACATFSRALKELVAVGFIDPVEKGGLRGCGKSCSRFKLSRRWEQYGNPDFKEVKWNGFGLDLD